MTYIILNNQKIEISSLNLLPLKGGYTNDSYIFVYDNKKYVLRIPTSYSQKLINRHIEGVHLKQMEDTLINVPTLYFNEVSGIKVSPYIKCRTLEDVKLDNYTLVIKKIEQLHKIPPSNFPFDVFKQINHYRVLSCSTNEDMQVFDDVINEAKSLYEKYPKVFSHNDLTPGNILLTQDNVYLIDYEYAGDNIELFDVVSFALENFLKEKRFDFYNQYYRMISSSLMKDIYLMECLQSYLWYYWALYMFQSTGELIYQSFMDYRLTSLKESYSLFKGGIIDEA